MASCMGMQQYQWHWVFVINYMSSLRSNCATSTSNINDMVETSSSSGGVHSRDDNDDDFSSFDTYMSHLIC